MTKRSKKEQAKYQIDCFQKYQKLLEILLERLKETVVSEPSQIYEKLSLMYEITKEELDIPLELLKQTDKLEQYPTSKQESIELCRAFLKEVDPSLIWLRIFNDLVKNQRIIDIRKRTFKNDYGWQCVLDKKGNWYILASWEENITDAISLIHEFAHYVAIFQVKKRINYIELDELPSIYWEKKMCAFLVEHNYPKQAVYAYTYDRKIHTISLAEENISEIYHMKNLITGKNVTLQTEIDWIKEQENAIKKDNEEFSYEKANELTYEQLAITHCNEKISSLLKNAKYFLERHTYIIGEKYGSTLFNESLTNSIIDKEMITITENLYFLTTDEILKTLDLYPNKPTNKLVK